MVRFDSFMRVALAALGLTACSSLPASDQNTAPVLDSEAEVIYQVLLGELAGRQGQVGLALDSYDRASEIIADARLHERTAQLALYQRNWPRALAALQAWSELDRENTEVFRLQAEVLLQLGRSDEAADKFKQLLNQSELSTQGLNLVSATLLRHDARESLKIVDTLTQAFVDQPTLLNTQAQLLNALGRDDQAFEILQRVAVLDPDDKEAILQLVDMHIAAGNADKALALVETLAEDQPEGIALQYAYLQTLVANDVKAEKVADQARKVAALLPERDVERLLPVALQALEGGAVDVAEELLTRLPDDGGQRGAQIHYLLAAIAEERGDVDEALAILARISPQQPLFIESLTTRARLLLDSGDQEQAVALLEKTIGELTDASAQRQLRLELVAIFRGSDQLLRAEQLLSLMLKVDDEDDEVRYLRGMTRIEYDDFDGFNADMTHLISVDAKAVEALNALGYVLANRNIDLARAAQLITRALALKPDDPPIMDSQGWLHFRRGEYAQAQDWLSRAYALLVDPEIGAHLGEVLWVQGQKQEATRLWQTLREEFPDNPILQETMQRFLP